MSRRMYASYPRVDAEAKTFRTWEVDEGEKTAHQVPSEAPVGAAELWGLVKWERLAEGGVVDVTNFELCVRDGDVVRRFDVTIELTPRALVQELEPFARAGAAPAGGAR